MDLAVERAIGAACTASGAFRHGAAVVCRNEVVAVGRNHYLDCHPRLHSVHAEMDALMKVPRRLRRKPMSIVVVRVAGDGHLRLSRPCPICQKLLEKFRITKVYYSENGSLTTCTRAPSGSRPR